jgi:hypothetical protein
MKLEKKRGIALIAVLLVLSLLFVITMGFAAFTTDDYLISQSSYTSTTTFYLSQAGLEYFIFLMKHNMLIFPAEAYGPYTEIGQVINVFGNHSDAEDLGQTHMIISELSWGSVNDIFSSTRVCGCFRLHALEKADDINTDPNKRVLYVESIGMIKEVPSAAGNDASSWQYWVDTGANAFPVLAQRTLEMRVPYAQGDYMKLYEPNSWSNSGVSIYQEILIDGWVERYR